MSNDKGPLAESDEKLKELDEKARAVLIDVIEKGRLNLIDMANILSQITALTETAARGNRSGCARGCYDGCRENCAGDCACVDRQLLGCSGTNLLCI